MVEHEPVHGAFNQAGQAEIMTRFKTPQAQKEAFAIDQKAAVLHQKACVQHEKILKVVRQRPAPTNVPKGVDPQAAKNEALGKEMDRHHGRVDRISRARANDLNRLEKRLVQASQQEQKRLARQDAVRERFRQNARDITQKHRRS